MKKYIIFLCFSYLGADFLPYISPGIKIIYNGELGLSISNQITFGLIGDDIGLGITMGYSNIIDQNKNFKYTDFQISNGLKDKMILNGFGFGLIYDRSNINFKLKAWTGYVLLFTYEHIFWNYLPGNLGFVGVLPLIKPL